MEAKPEVDPSEKVYDRHRKSRKGAGAKAKSDKKFTEKRIVKNQQGQDKADKFIADMKEQLRQHALSAMGEKVTTTTSVIPTQECKPTTWKAADLADHVVTSLVTANKIKLDQNFDIEQTKQSLQLITACQIEAKIHFSRRGSVFQQPWEKSKGYCDRMEHIAKSYSRNFSPIVTFINQIGRFSLNGQEYVPWAPEDLPQYSFSNFTERTIKYAMNNQLDDHHIAYQFMPYLRPSIAWEPQIGYTRMDVEHLGHPMCYQVLDMNVALANGMVDDRGNLLEPRYVPTVIDFQPCVQVGRTRVYNEDDLLTSYSELQTRARGKCRQEWPEVDLISGRGTAAQLVASAPDQFGHHIAWSAREVPDTDMMLGAVFGLGSNDPAREDIVLYNRDVAIKEMRIQTQNALQNIANLVIGDFL